MKAIFRAYLAHEGPAWTATAVWAAILICVVLAHGLPYDPKADLSLEEWSHLGSIVSAAVAPIAVLWVVRSFYVQKRELASAVEAANAQSVALGDQVEMMKADRVERTKPDLRVTITAATSDIDVANRYMVQHPEGSVAVANEDFSVRLKNAGRGDAYDVLFVALGRSFHFHDKPLATKSLEVFEVNAYAPLSFQRVLTEGEPATMALLVSLSYTNVDRQRFSQHWIYDMQSRSQREVREVDLGEHWFSCATLE